MGRSLFGLVLALVLIPLLFLPGAAHFLALYSLESPEAVCGSCHVHRRVIKTWRHSTHQGVSCADCHSSSDGVFAKETAVLQLLCSCLKSSLFGEKRVAELDSKTCLRCHSRFYEIKQLSAGEHLPHPHQECTNCHRALVHGSYDRDALVLAVREKQASLHVDADFPKRLSEAFSDKAHFQHGFMKTMSFCGECHKMAPSTADTEDGRALPRSPVCENCHVRY